jgi:hypothetical protein
VLQNSDDAKRYEIVSHLNPFYIHGDFNGDSRTDTAVLVKDRLSGKKGIAILHAGSKSVIVPGAAANLAMAETTSNGWTHGICTREDRSNGGPAKPRHRR